MTDPLHQFMIQTLIPLTAFGYDISFTNSSLFMALTSFMLVGVFYAGVKPQALVPSRLQVVLESLYSFVYEMVSSTVGEGVQTYVPYVFSLFLFIATGNLLGMLPYSFTFTSQLIVTFGLAVMVFIAVTILGFTKHGSHYFRLFLPEGTPLLIAPILVPIEVISYFARPVILALRLFANMTAGHAMLKIFAGFVVVLTSSSFFPLAALPFALNIILTVFEVFVCLLQAYVFTILTCIYLNDALHMH